MVYSGLSAAALCSLALGGMPGLLLILSTTSGPKQTELWVLSTAHRSGCDGNLAAILLFDGKLRSGC